jgi:HECT-like Ubiquitin-conjugating enzyme (E2)-binding
MEIQNFSIEFLRRIQAGNCYIKFKHALGKNETKVSLKPNQIIVEIDKESQVIETSHFFTINVKSFYNLLVKDDFISFRFIADEKRFGSEVLLNGPAENIIKFQRLEVSMKSEDPVTVTCSNCCSQLSKKDVNFRRILELPSSGMAISDWFCHRHEGEKIFHENGSDEQPASKIQCFNEETHDFQPKTSDLFYGPFHILMHEDIFDMSRFRQKDSLYCKRCLQLICKRDKNVLHFWWENLKFNNVLMYKDIQEPIELVRRIIANHISCDSLSFLSPIIKIIFESSIPSTGQKLHLLLQIMDKNLKLLTLDMDKLKLVEVTSIKVMYLILDKVNDDDDERTLKYWQKDINTMTFEFSFKMFTIFTDYLASQSAIIPEIYRFNNSFQLSYIEV